MRHETTWELKFSELETKAEVKQHGDWKLGGRKLICVGQGKVALRLLLRRRLQQADAELTLCWGAKDLKTVAEAKHTRGYAVSECLRVKAVTEIKVSTKAQG